MLTQINQGFADLKISFLSFAQWLYLGTQDIRMRYRRSLIGPWWVTLSTGIMIMILGFLWSNIFHKDIYSFMPFFAIGYVIWQWISLQIIESASGFSQFQAIISQISLPFPVYIFRLSVRHFLVMIHNLVVVALVVLFFGHLSPGLIFLTIPAFLLIAVNITLLSIVVSIFCTRYQDMTQVIATMVQIIFFFTPILWQPDLLQGHKFLINLNPIFHWIEIIRAPILGYYPTQSNWIWSICSLIFLSLISAYSLGRYKSRIAYWL